MSGLQPETSYVVCFDSVPDGDGSGGSGGMCKELKTLPELTATTTDGELGKRVSKCGLMAMNLENFLFNYITLKKNPG